MRLSLAWTRRLLDRADLGAAPAELHRRLSQQVVEIEPAIGRTGPNLDGVVVGKVLTCVQHPNADRLRCTTVDIGGAVVPVVCGAANVAAGLTVAVATVGTQLTMPGKDGAPATITIKATKLRGEPSEGMICAEDELGLGTSHEGIMVLLEAWAAGTPLAQAMQLGDAVFTIENSAITHRSDLWGHLGWAREIAALQHLPAPPAPDVTWTSQPAGWSCQRADDGCSLWCGVVVEGVANGPSPAWLADSLSAAGVRPLGLLVDITNYVMLELGEPMHAFDLRHLSGQRITVRSAAAGEVFRTLDGRDHTLAVGDLLIADERRALALAGIMGGEGSMVQPDTTAVLLEAAIFAPARIRRTRLRTGISTDSSARFEKGLHSEHAVAALNRAVALLRELSPGCRVTARFHDGPLAGEDRVIALDDAAVRRLTGMEVAPDEQTRILDALGFAAVGPGQRRVPWWRRKDVTAANDLVEEVARHHGYDRLVPEVPRLLAEAPRPNVQRQAEHRARRVLSAQGWDEVATYAFASDAWCAALGADVATLIRLQHPLSSEHAVLRPSLLPGLLTAVAANRKHQESVAIYELGKRYGLGLGQEPTVDEEVLIAGATAAATCETPIYAARDAALALLGGLGHVASVRARSTAHAELATGRALDVLVEGAVVGWCGEVPKPLRDLAACPERVGWFCVELERLVRAHGEPKPITHHQPSRFPGVDLDFTWQVPEAQPYGELAAAMRQAAGDLATDVALVGQPYRGAPYPEGTKAVSVRIWLQSDERTLEDTDKARIKERIITAVTKRTGAVLRG